MGGMIYDFTYQVFGPGLAKDIGDLIDALLTAMKNILSAEYLNGAWTMIMSIAASLLVIYFFQDLASQASRDMFSFEKLIVGFIRMLVAFAVLLYLKEIVLQIANIGIAFKNMVLNEVLDAGLANSDSVFNDDLRQDYKDYFDHIMKILEALGCIIGLFIPYIISIAVSIMAKLIIASNVIMLIVRSVFSPIAAAQMFEDGTRSSGMRYIKGMIADAITFGVIIAMVGIANKVSAEWIDTIKTGNFDLSDPSNVIDVLGFDTVFPLLIPKLAIAGGMAGASKVSHDMLGA